MRLKYDAVAPLLASGNEAVVYFTKRDLLGEDPGSVEQVWALPAVDRILKKQRKNGSWNSPNRRALDYPEVNYTLIESWKQFRHLIEKYGLIREHPAAEKAAEYLFSCQTSEGDIRGILANQYTIYYTGAILSLLVRAGYADDPRVERAFQWLLKMRQDDGGWVASPFQTLGLSGKEIHELTSVAPEPCREHDKSKPFSHNWTGMVMRAFAHHPKYRRSEAAKTGARLLASRFFQPDAYTSYQHPDNWLRFDYPFWWNNLVAALDSVSRIAGPDDNVRAALGWFVEHQQENGLWKTSYSRVHKAPADTARNREVQLWIALAICRFTKRLQG